MIWVSKLTGKYLERADLALVDLFPGDALDEGFDEAEYRKKSLTEDQHNTWQKHQAQNTQSQMDLNALRANEPQVRLPFFKKRRLEFKKKARENEIARLEKMVGTSREQLDRVYISPLELSTLVTALEDDKNTRAKQIKRRIEYFLHHGYETFEQAIALHAQEHERASHLPNG